MGYCTYFNGELAITPPLMPRDRVELLRLGRVGYQEAYPAWWTMRETYPTRDPEPHRCDWVVDELGEALSNEGEKTYDYVEQLEYLIKDFFGPRGYVLNGRVDWSGEEDDDLGAIFVRDNEVRAAQARIIIEDPFDSEAS